MTGGDQADYRIVGGAGGTIIINSPNYLMSSAPGGQFGTRCNATDLKKDGTHVSGIGSTLRSTGHTANEVRGVSSGIFVDTGSKNVYFHASEAPLRQLQML